MARNKDSKSKVPFLGLPLTSAEAKKIQVKLKAEDTSARRVMKKLLLAWADE